MGGSIACCRKEGKDGYKHKGGTDSQASSPGCGVQPSRLEITGKPPPYVPRRRAGRNIRLRVEQPFRAVPTMGQAPGVSVPEYEESVERINSLIGMTQRTLAMALQADREVTEWDSCKPTKGLEDCLVQVTEYDRNVLVRVQCTMNASREDIVAVLDSDQGGGAPKGTKTELLERPHPRACLIWIAVKLPIVKDRDFVCCQWIPQSESEESTATVVRVSVPTDVASELRPEIRKYVRGTIVMQCTFITPHPEILGKSTVKWLSCVDPGGSLPNVKGMTGTKGGEAVLALQKAVYSTMPV